MDTYGYRKTKFNPCATRQDAIGWLKGSPLQQQGRLTDNSDTGGRSNGNENPVLNYVCQSI